jgi:hypothetical protein
LASAAKIPVIPGRAEGADPESRATGYAGCFALDSELACSARAPE